jgi:hypothetical protein
MAHGIGRRPLWANCTTRTRYSAAFVVNCTVTNAPTAWLTRTGSKGYALHECVKNGVVALKYVTVPDAAALSHDEITAHVVNDDDVEPIARLRVAEMLHQYVNDLQVGDIVVTPHDRDGLVYFGEVTGEYRFDESSPVPDLRHLRDVRWLGSMDRDRLPPDRLKQIDRPPVFYELASNDFWLEQARAATVDDVLAPKRQAPPAVHKRPTSRTAPPAAVDEARCSSCFITVPSSAIVDGRCVDCR